MDDYDVTTTNATPVIRAKEAAGFIAEQLPAGLHKPRLGIICGSGLGGLADTVLSQPRHEISYSTIPHFPSSSGIDD